MRPGKFFSGFPVLFEPAARSESLMSRPTTHHLFIDVWQRYRQVIIPAFLAALFIFAFPFAGLLDMPNHLARAYVIKSCLWDTASPVCAHYALNFTLTPYMLSDAPVVALLMLFQPLTAEKSAVFFAFLLFIASWYCLSRKVVGTVNIAYLAGLSLALNNYINNGFYAFWVSQSLALAWICAWWSIRDRKTLANQIYLSISMLIIGGFHLAGLLFVFLVYGLYDIHKCMLHGLKKGLNTAVKPLFSLPMTGAFFGVLLLLRDSGGAGKSMTFKSALGKLEGLLFPFINYARLMDFFIIGMVLLIMLLSVDRTKLMGLAKNYWFFASLIFFGLYIISPVEINGVYDFDARFLPLAYLALFIAVGQNNSNKRIYSYAVSIVLLISFASSMYCKNLINDQLMRIHTVMSYTQSGKRLAAINSLRNYPVSSGSRVSPFPYFSHYYVVNGGALVTGLFHGDVNKNIAYFRYADKEMGKIDHYKLHFGGISHVQDEDMSMLIRKFDYILVIAHEGDSYVRAKLQHDALKLIIRDDYIYLFEVIRKHTSLERGFSC